jgi:D-alanyl-D-alanine carboxypeptidase
VEQTDFNALIERQVGKGHVHNVVAAVRSGDADLAAAAGIADQESGSPMTPDTPYLLASISKTYTAAAVLKVVETGRLRLEDRLVDLLPTGLVQGIHVYKGTDHTAEITVDHLLTQTSGLADYYEGEPKSGRSVLEQLIGSGDRAVELPEVLDIVRSLQPAFPPGMDDKAHYSDTNYRLLGVVYEAATGDPITQGYREVIYEPLGLTRTYPYAEVAGRPDRAPAATYLRDRTLYLPEFLCSHVAEGGLVSTAAESLAFMQAFFEGKLFDRSLLHKERYRAIFSPLQYGYGTMRFALPRLFSPFRPAPELLGHSGSTGSFAYLDPARDVYLSGTVNQMKSPGRAFRLMMRILNRL